jgi:4-amino-4-deoxychorismate lyase
VNAPCAADAGAVRIFHGDAEIAALPPHDRGIAYGDGLFESMRAVGGGIPWWAAHWSRLRRGAERLGLRLPDEALARGVVASMLTAGDAVVRLQVSRGPGARGYGVDPGAQPVWLAQRSAVPATRESIAVRWCATRLAVQPALAGIKHCNRLEQVLARSEWHRDGAGFDEGLMQDTDGFVVCATAANLFVLRDSVWLTPPVDRCGVRGVCREWLLDASDAREERMERADVEHAEAILLCNAVRGILEVGRLGDQARAPHPRIARLRECLAAAHPAFATTSEFT